MATSPTTTFRELGGLSVDARNTCNRLRSSAIKHFSAKGYDATSIRDIIEDAGVTRPVLYYYFKNKEDLFTKLVESEFEEALEELDAAILAGVDFRDTLIRLMRVMFCRAEASPDVVRMLLQFFFAPPDASLAIDRKALADKRFERIVGVIQRGLDAGEIAGGDAPSLALVFSGIMDTHVMAKSSRPEGVLTPELAEGLVDLFLGGTRAGQSLRVPLVSSFKFDGSSVGGPVQR